MPSTSIALSGAGTKSIAGVAGKVIRLLSLFGTGTGAGTLQLKSSGGSALSGPMNFSASGTPALALPHNPEGWAESLAGEGLDIVAASAGFNGGAVYQVTGS